MKHVTFCYYYLMEEKNNQTEFHQRLKKLMDEYVEFIYRISKKFPKEELYGITSQLRRSTLSIILNYIEEYARRRKPVFKNFLEISYGSLKESKYLLFLSYKLNYFLEKEYKKGLDLSEEIGKMLWGIGNT